MYSGIVFGYVDVLIGYCNFFVVIFCDSVDVNNYWVVFCEVVCLEVFFFYYYCGVIGCCGSWIYCVGIIVCQFVVQVYVVVLFDVFYIVGRKNVLFVWVNSICIGSGCVVWQDGNDNFLL